MSDLTPMDHVALELCPQHVTCASCQHRADVFARFIDDKIRAAITPVHVVMKGWAAASDTIPVTPQQAGSVHALTCVLEELRGIVGHEGEPDRLELDF